MNLPYWDRTPTEASAEIAHHCTEFLGKNMAVIQKYVRDGVAPGDDAPTNTGQGVVNGAPGAPPVRAIGLVNTEFAIEQFKVLVDHLGKPEPG